ncbi:hypothetical protein GCM10023197_26010 [Gordonia humi]
MVMHESESGDVSFMSCTGKWNYGYVYLCVIKSRHDFVYVRIGLYFLFYFLSFLLLIW